MKPIFDQPFKFKPNRMMQNFNIKRKHFIKTFAKTNHCWFVFSFLLLISYSVPKSTLPADKKPISILFLGNSLTYANDLPGLVEALALENGMPMRTQMIAKPNYALVDHLAEGQIQSALKNKFDYLVIQQGPSSQEEGRQMLLDASQQLKMLCDPHGTKLVVYMVWPAHINYSTFDGVIKNYTDAAVKANALLIPAGKKWKEHIDQTKDLSYYDSDLFHPSPKGSQMVAQLIYEAIKKDQPDHMK